MSVRLTHEGQDMDAFADEGNVIVSTFHALFRLTVDEARDLARDLISSAATAEGVERSATDEKIVGLHRKGDSIRQIADHLNVTIHRVRKAIDSSERV